MPSGADIGRVEAERAKAKEERYSMHICVEGVREGGTSVDMRRERSR